MKKQNTSFVKQSNKLALFIQSHFKHKIAM